MRLDAERATATVHAALDAGVTVFDTARAYGDSEAPVALGAGGDEALRGGVAALAVERGLWLLAHAPFGGPKRAARLARDPLLVEIAARHDATPAQVVLAWLLALHPRIVPLPGATHPE